MSTSLEELNSRVSLRRLEIFCLVVELGGVTRAAEHLLIAQPAVSSQLRQLERWLGAKLLFRDGNRLALTDAGERTYTWAREVLAKTMEVHRDVAGLRDGSRGTAVVTASMAVGTYFLAPLLCALRTSRPSVELTLHVMRPEDALRAVETGEADLALLGWHGATTPSSIAEEPIHEPPVVLCAAPNGPPASDTVSPSDVTGLPHVGAPSDSSFQRLLEKQLRDRGIEPGPVIIRLGHTEAMKRAAALHSWVVWLPRYAVAEELSSGVLREIAVDGIQLTERISLFYRRDKQLSPLQLAVIETARRASPAVTSRDNSLD